MDQETQTQMTQPSTQSQTTSQPQAQTPTTPQQPQPIYPTEWDKQKKQISKTFYRTFSPRLLYIPFSYEIDIDRAQKVAIGKGYTPVKKGMVLDTGGMFTAEILVEVENANETDKDVVSLKGKELYTKVSDKSPSKIKEDIATLESEIGKKPANTYIWWTKQPSPKAVIIAVL